MQHAKLVELLRCLSTRERTRFRAFVHSPFFNKHKKLRALCDYLLEQAPEFEAGRLDKAAIYELLHPGESYQEDRMNNLNSDLLNLLYEYLVQLQLENRQVQKQQWLVVELMKREVPKHVKRSLGRLGHLIKNAKGQSAEHYLHESRRHALLDHYQLDKGKRRYHEHLQLQNDCLDIYYFIDKFRMACNMISRNIVINAKYECRMLPELLDVYLKSDVLRQIPVLRIYYATFRMLEGKEGDAFFDKLKGLLEVYGKLFSKEELRSLYHYALNFCIRRINSGDSRFYKETLHLYNTMLRRKILFEKGVLSQWSFKNIVTTGLRLEDFDWTEQFIRVYQDYLPPEDRFNAVTYNLAAYHYARGDYKQALVQLQDVEFTDSSYHLGAKIIQLKCYYELDETEPLLDLISAFRQYLRRNRQISDYRKKANVNFLRAAKDLARLRNRKELLKRDQFRQQLQALHQMVDKKDPLANKEWLQSLLSKMA